MWTVCDVATRVGTEPPSCLPIYMSYSSMCSCVQQQESTEALASFQMLFSSPLSGNNNTVWVLGSHHLPVISSTDQDKAKAQNFN